MLCHAGQRGLSSIESFFCENKNSLSNRGIISESFGGKISF